MKRFRTILLLIIISIKVFGQSTPSTVLSFSSFKDYYDPGDLKKLSQDELKKLLTDINANIGSGSSIPDDYYNRGVIKGFLGDTVGALTDYNKSIDIDKKHFNSYINRGSLLQNMQKYAEALKDFNMAINLNPLSALPYNIRGYLKQVEKKWKEAIVDYDKAILLDKTYTTPYVNKIRTLILLKNYKEAEIVCNKLIETYPLTPGSYLERADLYQVTKDTEAALADLNKALELSKNDPIMLIERAKFKDDVINDDQGAVIDCNAAISMAPTNALYYYERSRPLFDLQEFNNVISDCSRAISLDSNLYEAYVMRGNVYDMLGKTKLALNDYQTAIRIKPRHHDAYYQLSVFYITKNDFKSALSSLDIFFNSKSENIKLRNQRGHIKMMVHDFNGAKEDFSQLIKLLPEESTGYYSRGIAEDSLGDKKAACADMKIADKLHMAEAHLYLRKNCKQMLDPKLLEAEDLLDIALKQEAKGDYAGGIKTYTQAIALLPDSASFYYNRGFLKRKLDDHEGAILDYKKSLGLNKNFEGPTWISIGVSQQLMGKDAEAMESYKKSIEVNPEDAMAYYNLGNIVATQHKLDEAVSLYKLAIRYNNKYIKAYMALGECYVLMGNKADACNTFKKAEALGDGTAISKRIFNCN